MRLSLAYARGAVIRGASIRRIAYPANTNPRARR